MPEPKRPLKVFLCHASTDKPKVRELYRYLKKRGIQPWFDEEHLVGGQDWQVEIPKALATSDAIIICLTKNSVDKEGYIQKEIKFALDKALEMPEGRIFLIPVKFEECEVPFSLSRYQWVDLTVESGYAKMMKALKFRASQLERNTVQLPKDNIDEDKLALEKASRERTEKEATEKARLEVEEQERQKAAKEKAARDKAIPGVIQKNKHTSNRQTYFDVSWIVGGFGIIGVLAAIVLIGVFYFKEILLDFVSNAIVPTAIVELPVAINDVKGIEMMLIPAGEFTMGGTANQIVAEIPSEIWMLYQSSSWYQNVEPKHKVFLDAYYVDKYEVFNVSYRDCVNATVCRPLQQNSSDTRSDYYENSAYDYYPVINVDWNMAKTYCEWRGARLLTEAEWEKAARGTNDNLYPWGNNIDLNNINLCAENCTDTQPVNAYPNGISPYGVYNMAGNVSEWVADWYDDSYYEVSPLNNPLGPKSGNPVSNRVIRGGSWRDEFFRTISFFRDYSSPDDTFNDSIGFRCARDANP